MKAHNSEVLKLKESIFSTITQRAIKEEAINLAQGFPDFDGPHWVVELAQKVLMDHKNQYAPSMGILSLRQEIANLYKRHYSLEFNPENEILITHGATEGLYSTIKALVNPGDEVIVFEPLYDSYAASVLMAGGVLKPVTLRAPDFSFDQNEFLAQLSPKTKLLIINNPHNPTGKVFSQKDIQWLAEKAKENDFYIISDEVYEFLTFNEPHKPTASLKDIKDRVITISSIGKTLSFTGWKIGWVIASKEIIKSVHNVHQFVNFCVNHPLQVTLALALPQMEHYLTEFRRDYALKRNLLMTGLRDLNFKVIEPEGTYFLLTHVPEGVTSLEYCYSLITNQKVATIPLSPFYLKSNEGDRFVRFCFAKKEETLVKALENLGRNN